MKRILINATQNEEIRVALCTGNHLYDFDLENRTREQKKSNIYKGHVTRVEPSLEAVFVEYGSQRQGFLPIREISTEYLSGNPRDENIKKLIKEGDELIVQVEKEERGNKGAALSTYVSLAGRYLVLMPNNPRGGGISRQISGKLREDMKRMLGNLDLPKGMSVIIRTAGIGKTQEDLQHDLNHLLNIWQAIQEQNQKYPSPRLVHQEAGVVTRAVRDYLRDDISEIWIDNENAYIEAAGFIDAVMPKQAEKLRKYTDYEPMFSRFNIEKQIETAYQREVRLPSGGSIVIDQTEALVSIDINSAKSTKGSDVAETAFHTNLEAADEIARQLRLRDMGGLIVIDFIDMNDNKNQKEVEKRLIDATKYDRARVQFGEISKFGLMEMSRQRLRPSLEESTGYICPRCHGNGMIRDLRSLSLSIMRQIEQIALKERQGEVQAEVPTDIAAFLLNEKRDALVYLEQDSGTRITILPHAHLESPNFKLHFNRDGFAPSSYERITDTQQQEHSDLGYNVDWQTADSVRPEQQPTRQPRPSSDSSDNANNGQTNPSSKQNQGSHTAVAESTVGQTTALSHERRSQSNSSNARATQNDIAASEALVAPQPQAVAWLSNLFAKAPQAQIAAISSHDAAEAIETLVNTGAKSLGTLGQVDAHVLDRSSSSSTDQPASQSSSTDSQQERQHSTSDDNKEDKDDERRRRKTRKSRSSKPHQRKEQRGNSHSHDEQDDQAADSKPSDNQAKDDRSNKRNSDRSRPNQHKDQGDDNRDANDHQDDNRSDEQARSKRKPHSQRSSRGHLQRGEALEASTESKDTVARDKAANTEQNNQQGHADSQAKQSSAKHDRSQNPNEVVLQINEAPTQLKTTEVVHLSLDNSKTSKPDNALEQHKEVKEQTEAKHTVVSQEEKVATTEPVTDTPVEAASAAEQSEEAIAVVDTGTTTTLAPVAASAIVSAKENATDDKEVAGEPAFALNHTDLFADRYVTAKQYGQASNDPRAVRSQQTSTVSRQVDAAANTTTVRGTVGAFIRATLAEAESRLANDGVIHCFIAAITEHTKQSADARTATEATSDFDFSNYGYESLSADYLERFRVMTTATAQVDAAQGKTEVAPRAIAQRASNDPRGQHPDYVTEQAKESSVKLAESALEQPPQAISTESQNSSAASEVDVHSVAASALTGSMKADQISAESEQLLKADQAHADDLDASSNSSESANVESSHTQIADMVDGASKQEATKEPSQIEKSKTTIASYKNMIENVAEQLLPQTGMFNLTTPKVPKARTRKPKTEHKKPTQAEKAEETNSDADNES